jgi:hypothetical protein
MLVHESAAAAVLDERGAGLRRLGDQNQRSDLNEDTNKLLHDYASRRWLAKLPDPNSIHKQKRQLLASAQNYWKI